MLWFFLHLVSAVIWVGWAVGWFPYEAWVPTMAFILLAANCVLSAMKSLVGAD